MVSDIYTDGKYLEHNPLWHTERSPWKAEKIFSILSRNKIEFTTVADVGCGAGEVVKQLQEKFPPDKTFSGYEISPQGFLKNIILFLEI
jgi:trans-aconitate methyltransferase